jgi:hypothetical protein
MYYGSDREGRDDRGDDSPSRRRNGETTIVANETLLTATDIIRVEKGPRRGKINLYYRLLKLQILYNERLFSIPDPALGAEYSNYNH